MLWLPVFIDGVRRSAKENNRLSVKKKKPDILSHQLESEHLPYTTSVFTNYCYNMLSTKTSNLAKMLFQLTGRSLRFNLHKDSLFEEVYENRHNYS